MKTQQIQEIEQLEEVIFEQSSNVVQVGFRTDKSTLLQIAKSVEILGIQEATFTIDEEGLTFRAMDSSHIRHNGGNPMEADLPSHLLG